MPQNDNAHSLRLVESLKNNNCSKLAEQLKASYPLSKSASIEKNSNGQSRHAVYWKKI